MAEEKQVAVVPKKIEQCLDLITVVVEGGETVQVPVNAEANKILSQISAARMRAFVSKTIALYEDSDIPIKPLELKAVVDSWAKADDNARSAYANLLTEAEGGEASGITAAQAIKAHAEGTANAIIKAGAADRARQIRQLGQPREKNVTKIIEVEE